MHMVSFQSALKPSMGFKRERETLRLAARGVAYRDVHIHKQACSHVHLEFLVNWNVAVLLQEFETKEEAQEEAPSESAWVLLGTCQGPGVAGVDLQV